MAEQNEKSEGKREGREGRRGDRRGGRRGSFRGRGEGRGGRGRNRRGRGGRSDRAPKLPPLEENVPLPEKFQDLGLSEQTLKAVHDLGYESPTPVQELAIPEVLSGKDLLAAAQTGTGKTAAFLLPTMDRLEKGGKGCHPSLLVVTPTRELAQQIDEHARTISRRTGHYTLTVVGGLSYNPQRVALKRGVDVLVATPGRLCDLINQGAAHLDEVKVLVLDEADRMLDMGFLPDVRKIVDLTPEDRQTLLFSATLDDSAIGSIKDLVHDPARVEIVPENTPAETVEQFVLPVSGELKNTVLVELLYNRGPEHTIVFTRTKRRAEMCMERLQKAGISAEAIHGDRSQAQRQRALKAFRDGRVDVIVATDVLARGIDVQDVRYVVNFDIPEEPVDYIHRIGRTGRAGETGWAVTIVTSQDLREFLAIEKMMDKRCEIYDPTGLSVGDYAPFIDPDRVPSEFDPRGGRKGRGRGGKGGGRASSRKRREGERGGRRRERSRSERDERPRKEERRDLHAEGEQSSRADRSERKGDRGERGAVHAERADRRERREGSDRAGRRGVEEALEHRGRAFRADRKPRRDSRDEADRDGGRKERRDGREGRRPRFDGEERSRSERGDSRRSADRRDRRSGGWGDRERSQRADRGGRGPRDGYGKRGGNRAERRGHGQRNEPFYSRFSKDGGRRRPGDKGGRR